MTFPYDTPFVADKEDLDTFPEVAAINKATATDDWNPLLRGVNALATAVTAGEYLGLAAGASPAVAPTGGVRLKAGAAGLEASFSGGAYAPVAPAAPDVPLASGTVAGIVGLGDQTMGSGSKQFTSPIRLQDSAEAGAPGGNEVLLSSVGGVLRAACGGSFDHDPVAVSSWFGAPQSLQDDTVELLCEGGVVAVAQFETTLLTGPITLSGVAHGPVGFIGPGAQGLVTLLYLWGTPGLEQPVTVPHNVSCQLAGGVDFVMHVGDSLTLFYSAANTWHEVSRAVAAP